MSYLKLVLVLFVSGVIFIGGLVWLHPGAHPDLKYALTGEISSLNTILLYIAMLAGGLAKSLHFELEKLASERVKSSVLRRSLTNRSLFISLIVSPITFLIVYKAAGTEPDHIVAFLLSFQNGFFWKAILEGVKSIDNKK
jgi:hypothetical protein